MRLRSTTAALFFFPAFLFAQSSANIVGTVRDSSGAVVPEAQVKVVNTQTGYTQSRATAADGSYRLPLLPVGQYELTAEKSGFQKFVQTGIVLAVNDNATIDITMNVGAVSEAVTVTGAAPLVDTQSGTIKGLVDQQRIVDLPLNGRDITQLMSIQAGVISRGGSYGEGNQFVVNGSRGNGVYYLLDTGMNTDSYRNYSGVMPNPDAVQEFSIQKSNFSAEYANATGAVVNVVTKSGTNQFHGAAFEFVRNAQFNARNFFAARRDSLKRNQFGATLGGPVRKDKLFFFFAYQGTRLRSDPQLSRQFLPTGAMRRGDFSALGRAIKDPITGANFPNAQIPLSRISPITQAFLKYLPDPGTPDGSRFTGTPAIEDTNEYTGKVDWVVRAHRVSGRLFYTKFQRPFTGKVDDYASMSASEVGKSTQPYRQLTLNDMWTVSPTLINSLTFAYRGRRTLNDWSAIKLPLSFKDAGVKGIAVQNPTSVYISVSGGFLSRPGWYYDKTDYDLQFADTATYIRGRHEFKFGGEILRSANDIKNHFRTMGLFTFNGSISGNAMADFVLGDVYQFWQGGGEYKSLFGTRWGFFGQDTIRATSNLTLTAGLRWDPQFPFHDDLGRVQCFRPGVPSTRYPKAPLGYLSAGDPGCPDGGFDPYMAALAPRLGFAWRPGGKNTVVRGGAGLFWNPQFTVLYNTFVDSAPFSPQIVRYGVRFEDPYGTAGNPFPQSFAPFIPGKDVEFFTPLGQFGVFNNGFRPSYQETWNITVERELTRNLAAHISYIGNQGRHLSYGLDVNYALYVPGQSTVGNIQQRRPYQNYGSVLNAFSEGNSSYHGLQMSVERRVANGISVEANYTWSKSIDESSSEPTPGQGSSIIPYSRKANRGPSDFDINHRFVLSYVWALPRLSTGGTLVRNVIGGWESSGFWTMQTGTPFGIASGTDRSLSGLGIDNADLIGNPYLDTNRPRKDLINQYFNTAAFAPAALGTFGTAPRNFMRRLGSWNADLSLMKKFRVREGTSIQFRSEFFNAFNNVNLSGPQTSLNVANRFGRIESAGSPRIIQFGLKLLF
ncbi:MAG: carboxypeptidase regulatory-like domain-containing protein [Bryobacteraceae bacterium]